MGVVTVAVTVEGSVTGPVEVTVTVVGSVTVEGSVTVAMHCRGRERPPVAGSSSAALCASASSAFKKHHPIDTKRTDSWVRLPLRIRAGLRTFGGTSSYRGAGYPLVGRTAALVAC